MDHTGMELDRMDLEDYRAGRPLRSESMKWYPVKLVPFDTVVKEAAKLLTRILREQPHTGKTGK